MMPNRRVFLIFGLLYPGLIILSVVFFRWLGMITPAFAKGGKETGDLFSVQGTVSLSQTLTSTVTITSSETVTGTVQPSQTPTVEATPTPTVTFTLTPTATPTRTLYYLRLPLFINQILPPVDIVQMQIIDNRGFPRQAYIPGEGITVQSTGVNRRSVPVLARMTWYEASSCGNTTVVSDTVSLDPGTWSRGLDWQLSDCLGVFTYTVNVSYTEESEIQGIRLMVNNPSDVAITDQQAFDNCVPPSIQTMQTWWNHSPYYSINLYIGGISLAHDCTAIANPFWVSEVSQQGWMFILTWVGPQAPCSIFRHKMHNDPFITYHEGRLEADAAIEAANGMGFLANRIIYYDLEAFGSANLSCREAVKAFLNGWVERLHEQNVMAGVYGSGCGSFIRDWITIDNIPDAIWAARWYTNTWDPDASVWDIPCVQNDWWPDHQRLLQYTGDHTETWGGKALTIDSDAADGRVTRLPLPTTVPALDFPLLEQSVSNEVAKIHLGNDGMGWQVKADRLRFTTNSGDTWQESNLPDDYRQNEILAAFVRGGGELWVVSRDHLSGQLIIAYSNNAGSAWDKSLLPDVPVEAIVSSFQFIDSQNGWLGVKLPTSSNFNLGRLYHTSDGAKTWETISAPAGGPFYFLDQSSGWMLGGLENNELFFTRNGGKVWDTIDLLIPGVQEKNPIFYGLPHFFDSRDGTLLLTNGDLTNPSLLIYSTQDSGSSWFLSGEIKIDKAYSPGTAIPAAILDRDTIIANLPGTGMVKIQLSNSLEILPLDFPTKNVVQLSFSDSQNGWASVQNNICQGDKYPLNVPVPSGAIPFTCSITKEVYQTSDGGISWSKFIR